MEKLDQELIDIALTALANQKITVDKTTVNVTKLKGVVTEAKKKTTTTLKNLDTKLTTIQTEMRDTVASEMSKIPIPADGKDGYIGIDGIDGIDGKTGATGPIGKPGKDGKNGAKGKDGLNGINGKDGKDGKDGKSIPGSAGKDGVGISNIKTKDSKLLIEFSDGTSKAFKIPRSEGTPAGVTAMPTEIHQLRHLSDVKNVDTAVNGDLLTYTELGWVAEAPDDTLQKRIELESMFKTAQSVSYKELTYSDGNITNVDIYTTSGKTLKLFSKVIGYNSGNISNVSITDEVNGGTLNKTIAYTDGDITSVSTLYVA